MNQVLAIFKHLIELDRVSIMASPRTCPQFSHYLSLCYGTSRLDNMRILAYCYIYWKRMEIETKGNKHNMKMKYIHMTTLRILRIRSSSSFWLVVEVSVLCVYLLSLIDVAYSGSSNGSWTSSQVSSSIEFCLLSCK